MTADDGIACAAVQVFEARRFGADALLGEASLPVAAMPKEGRPKYHWLSLELPIEASTQGAGRIHVRVQWTPNDQQRSYRAVDVALQGIGVSMIDSMSRQVLRELAYIHVSDIQVRRLPATRLAHSDGHADCIRAR